MLRLESRQQIRCHGWRRRSRNRLQRRARCRCRFRRRTQFLDFTSRLRLRVHTPPPIHLPVSQRRSHSRRIPGNFTSTAIFYLQSRIRVTRHPSRPVGFRSRYRVHQFQVLSCLVTASRCCLEIPCRHRKRQSMGPSMRKKKSHHVLLLLCPIVTWSSFPQ